MDKAIRIGVYKILRKLGANRDEIYPDAFLRSNIFFDDKEWLCFLFFLESNFQISISAEEERGLITVQNTIEIVQNNLNFEFC